MSLYILIMIAGLILVLGPQWYVSSTYKKFLKKDSMSRMTGAETARRILQVNGLANLVGIESIRGELTDHYDPRTNTVRLSEAIYSGTSISSIAVAAHEVGHAIQENQGYVPIKFRSAIFPAASIGDKLGMFMLFGGFILMAWMGMTGLGQMIAILGIVLYSAAVFFQFVTLPVEFNASSRALVQLRQAGILQDTEIADSRKVLTAAALTYVAAALYAVINLLYWIYILFGRRD